MLTLRVIQRLPPATLPGLFSRRTAQRFTYPWLSHSSFRVSFGITMRLKSSKSFVEVLRKFPPNISLPNASVIAHLSSPERMPSPILGICRGHVESSSRMTAQARPVRSLDSRPPRLWSYIKGMWDLSDESQHMCEPSVTKRPPSSVLGPCRGHVEETRYISDHGRVRSTLNCDKDNLGQSFDPFHPQESNSTDEKW